MEETKNTTAKSTEEFIKELKTIAETENITFGEALMATQLNQKDKEIQGRSEIEDIQKKMMQDLGGILEAGKDKLMQLVSAKNNEAELLGDEYRPGCFSEFDEDFERLPRRAKVGNVVHFYPTQEWRDKYAKLINGAEYLPAIVYQRFPGDKINLIVQLFNGSSLSEGSVDHAKEAVGREVSYWLFPHETESRERDIERKRYAMAG